MTDYRAEFYGRYEIAVGDRQVDHGRAEDVAGVHEADLDGVGEDVGLVVG